MNSPNIKNLGVYTQAIQMTGGSLIFVSGCVLVDGKGNLVGKGDPAVQMRQVLTNIQTILNEAGADLGNVVKVTVFNVDLNNRKAMNEVRLEMFGEHRPASTHVEVTRLIDPDWLVEVECVAGLPG
ncbi:MAG: RidA family protein [Nitrospinota bacterium]|nr:RidA family protein [Nitrospinota bacterium]